MSETSRMVPPPPLPPASVVLVDDDNGLRAALSFSLETAGFSVMAFDCAEAALEAELPQAQTCMVLDLRLPGMSGLQAFAQFRGQGYEVPTVFITSNPKPEFRSAIKAAGETILEKPLLADSLLAAVRAAFNRGSPLSA